MVKNSLRNSTSTMSLRTAPSSSVSDFERSAFQQLQSLNAELQAKSLAMEKAVSERLEKEQSDKEVINALRETLENEGKAKASADCSPAFWADSTRAPALVREEDLVLNYKKPDGTTVARSSQKDGRLYTQSQHPKNVAMTPAKLQQEMKEFRKAIPSMHHKSQIEASGLPSPRETPPSFHFRRADGTPTTIPMAQSSQLPAGLSLKSPKCNICEKSFIRNDLLIYHLCTMHNTPEAMKQAQDQVNLIAQHTTAQANHTFFLHSGRTPSSGQWPQWQPMSVPSLAETKTETKSLFEKYKESVQERYQQPPKKSLITTGLVREGNSLKSPEAYTQPFCDFLTENPTVFHAVDYFEKKLEKAGFEKLSERKSWDLKKGGKYFISRNGSSTIAFTIGGGYSSGNGVAMIAGHVDALTARLKPVSNKKTSAGYIQLGVAPYAGALNETWWDRDLGIGGRVLVKDADTGKIQTRLVKLGWPIARIPTLAPHFGVGMMGQNNKETQAVPIIGLDNSDIGAAGEEFKNLTLGGAGTFAATQPPRLVRAIAGELSIQDYSSIVNWELELYDTQPAQVGGLDKEFIFGGRIDDKLCSWSAMEGLLASASAPTSEEDGIVKLVGVFDDEEIGSLLRQGAKGNFLPSVIERVSECFTESGRSGANVLSQTYANSFLISADVTHAVNPNFLSRYLEGHAPRLNVGLVVSADSNGHMTTDSVSTALLTRVAEKSGSDLQLFMIRNDSRSGGTVGPMLSSAMGVRAIDAGIPQLSMHSIRATTGAKDPGLGVKIFKGFFDTFESVDAEFE